MEREIMVGSTMELKTNQLKKIFTTFDEGLNYE